MAGFLGYTRKAFFVRWPIPGLGGVPVNVLAAAVFGLFGFFHPGFWFLGLGLEAAFVMALAGNRRFQKWVDAQSFVAKDLAPKRESLAATLEPGEKRRFAAFEGKCDRILALSRAAQREEILLESDADALDRLRWLFLKLLVARQHLLALKNHGDADDLLEQRTRLTKELERSGLSEAAREAKRATLLIVDQRLRNMDRRSQSLQEIDSDLARLEAQADLGVENAAIQGQPATLSFEVQLASRLVDGSLFGDAEGVVKELDRAYEAPGRSPGPVKSADA